MIKLFSLVYLPTQCHFVPIIKVEEHTYAYDMLNTFLEV